MPLRGEVNMNRRFKTKLALMSIPAAAGFIIFYVVPFFRSVGYSFVGRMVDKKFVGFQNYIELFQNEYFRMALTNTVIFSVVGVTLILIISLALSAGLVKLSSTFSFIKSFFVMPYVLPSASIIFFWQLFFDTERYVALEKIDGANGGVLIYNLGTGIGYSVLDVVKAYEKACGKEIPYVICPRRAGDIDESYSDPSLAEKELHWKAKYGIDEMCRDSWNWQKNNPNGYKS